MSEENSVFEKTNSWIRDSIVVKLVTIGVLIIVLFIPTAMTISIIEERKALSEEAIQEVSTKWSGSQLVVGPILTIPVVYEYITDDKPRRETKNWQILPEELNINGHVISESLHRGIYEVVVYESQIDIKGRFAFQHSPDPNYLIEILYDQAFLTVGISDLKGIKNQIVFNWDNQQMQVKPGSRIAGLINSGFTIDLPELSDQTRGSVPFNFSVDLQGSQNLSFVPVGGTTEVELSSAWSSPSFNGYFLPDERTVDEQGFSASWKVLQLNRNIPQSWTSQIDGPTDLHSSAFGVDLILPLDNYQKSMRSAKYAIMTIGLTFLIFFLVEIRNKQRIHPFQYTLVGLALTLFYILLLSITEHMNFNLAYSISAVSVVAMISLYGLAVLKSRRLSLVLVVTLFGIYGFLFVTMVLADYALLMGSIGLTLILAATMFLTRNIDWYGIRFESDQSSLSKHV